MLGENQEKMEIQTNWSVKDIKLLLQSKGISFSDCVEKQDLINRAIEKGILDPNDLSRLFPEVTAFTFSRILYLSNRRNGKFQNLLQKIYFNTKRFSL